MYSFVSQTGQLGNPFTHVRGHAAWALCLLCPVLATAKTQATITLAVTSNPAVIGQPLALTVKVSGTSGSGTGFVQFTANNTVYGTNYSLVNGTVTIPIPDASHAVPNSFDVFFLGVNNVGVRYSGDVNYLAQIADINLSVIPGLAISPPTVVYGQPVTFTATVDQGDTGGVSFFDGTTSLTPTPVPITGNTAQYSPPLPLTTGNHTITAVYMGISSNPISLSIGRSLTTTALSYVQNGTSVALTAAINPVAPGSGAPSGTVQFFNGNTLMGTVTVQGSQAQLSASNIAGTILAFYSGDGNFAASASPGISISAVPPPGQVSLTVSSGPNPSTLGQPVTISAGLTVVSGTTQPGGTITFFDGPNSLGSAGVGSASITVTSLAIGGHTISAQYSGDKNYPGASASTGQYVNRIPTTLSVSGPPGPVKSTDPVTFAAQIAPSPPQGVTAPSGQITFSDGANTLGIVPVSGGSASLTLPGLDPGVHGISASYSGDKNWIGSSGSTSVTVVKGPVTITTTGLPEGTVGVVYSGSLSAIGGTPPYTWAIGGLPPGLSGDASGTISGTPTTPGSFSVSTQVTDKSGSTASGTFSITITTLPLSISATLPNGKQGVDYSGTITVSGGVPPYQVTASGLPPGLRLVGSTTIAGQPTTTGTFQVTVGATDNAGGSISNNFSITIASTPLAVTTASLPGGTVGATYSATVAAVGGTLPYKWSGTVPAGLSLDPASGAITGTPTTAGPSTISVTVTDSAGANANNSYSVTFTLPAVNPVLSFTGLPATADPRSQLTFGVALSGPYPALLTGTVKLAFQPDTGTDTGEVTFAAGGRSVTFSFQPNSLTGVFAVPPAALQTGTVSGLITLTATLSAGGTDITPSPAPSAQIRVNSTPPVITSVQATRAGSALTIVITGYTPTREVSQAIFHFNPASGANLQTTDLTVPVASLFAPWLQGNQVLGSQFQFTQSFNVQGDTQAIASVTVTLVNAQGNSQPVTATLQ